MADGITRLGLTGAVVLGVVACSDPSENTPPPPELSRRAVIAPRDLSTEQAYDFIANPHGATLVWSPPGRLGGGIRMVRLGPQGSALSEERVVVPPTSPGANPVDSFLVRAARDGERLAVVWVERQPRWFPVRAVIGGARGTAFSTVQELSQLARDSRPFGAFALSQLPGGGFGVWVRRAARACGASSDKGVADSPTHSQNPIECVEVAGYRAQLAASGRPLFQASGPVLEVPAPCPDTLVGAHVSGASLFLGVCSQPQDSPRTMMYSVNEDSAYASAGEVAPGCRPHGLSTAPQGLLWRGSCTQGQGQQMSDALVTASLEASAPTVSEKEVHCAAGRLSLVRRDAGGEQVFRLVGPQAQLEGWLSESLAPARSRALWTGEALLIAVPQDRALTLRRFECVHDQLVRTDMLVASTGPLRSGSTDGGRRA